MWHISVVIARLSSSGASLLLLERDCSWTSASNFLVAWASSWDSLAYIMGVVVHFSLEFIWILANIILRVLGISVIINERLWIMWVILISWKFIVTVFWIGLLFKPLISRMAILRLSFNLSSCIVHLLNSRWSMDIGLFDYSLGLFPRILVCWLIVVLLMRLDHFKVILVVCAQLFLSDSLRLLVKQVIVFLVLQVLLNLRSLFFFQVVVVTLPSCGFVWGIFKISTATKSSSYSSWLNDFSTALLKSLVKKSSVWMII